MKIYEYVCSNCGKTKVLKYKSKRKGTICQPCTASIGKFRREHGNCTSRLYHIWACMKQRCTNSKHVGHKRYGGRGISYCDEWSKFIPFEQWAIENGYRDDLQLDRIDNDGIYCPGNCRWVTPAQNIRNSRVVKLNESDVAKIRGMLADGVKQKDIGKEFGVAQTAISKIKTGKHWVGV